MPISRRSNMLKWLKAGQRKAKRKIPPGDGYMTSLLYGDLDKNGGHYQIEYVQDSRFYPEPYVSVSWWPPRRRTECCAPYMLNSFQVH